MLVLALALSLGDFLFLLLLLPALFLHLSLHLLSAAQLLVDQDLFGHVSPGGLELVVGILDLFAVAGQLSLAHEQHTSVGNALIEVSALLLIHEDFLSLLQAVKGFGGGWVGAFIRMDKQRLGAVMLLDIRVWHTGLEIEDSIGIKLESLEDAVNLRILLRWISDVEQEMDMLRKVIDANLVVLLGLSAQKCIQFLLGHAAVNFLCESSILLLIGLVLLLIGLVLFLIGLARGRIAGRFLVRHDCYSQVRVYVG